MRRNLSLSPRMRRCASTFSVVSTTMAMTPTGLPSSSRTGELIEVHEHLLGASMAMERQFLVAIGECLAGQVRPS